MKTVHIFASKPYDVRIGSGILNSVGACAAGLKAGKVCIVSDSNVWPLYGAPVRSSLQQRGIDTCEFIFPAGESSKNAGTYLNLLNFMAGQQITRSDLIIALGGGVVGDLSGFAAATYLRGIRYIQVPTTLLAAVDSSVGGKTAIDLDAGKNLAGAFWQPSLVLCDTDCLNTLPGDIFRDGCAEVIKYGILYDPELFEDLAAQGLHFDREAVIARCVELKRDVVAVDEFDTGSRMKLNLGHTVGHGIEKESNFSLSHGKAVAIGTAIVTRAACKSGICSSKTQEAVLSVLNTFGLPCSSSCTAEALSRCALSDKKRSGGTVNLIVPEAIGSCIIHPIPIADIQTFIEAGL